MEEKTVVLGMFDGVHTGHVKLIHAAKTVPDASVLVYTFSDHPGAFLGYPVRLLTTNEERKELLLAAGADEVVMDPFTEETLHMSPEDFVRSLLERWNVRTVVAGYNYTFGDGGKGDANLLKELGGRYGFGVIICDAVLRNGEPVSSTRIRKALEAGRILSANGCLGRPYEIRGNALETLGSVTLRKETEKVCPKPGTYAVQIKTGLRDVYGTVRLEEGPEGPVLHGFHPEEGEDRLTVRFVSETDREQNDAFWRGCSSK